MNIGKLSFIYIPSHFSLFFFCLYYFAQNKKNNIKMFSTEFCGDWRQKRWYKHLRDVHPVERGWVIAVLGFLMQNLEEWLYSI